jgi:putative molybdopterin biosynthesis protein
MKNDLLTPQEVADILKIKKNTVYEMIKRGTLPAKRMGKQLRILSSSIKEYLCEQDNAKNSRQVLPLEILNTDPYTVPNIPSFVLSGQDEILDQICNLINQKFRNIQMLRSYLDSYNGLYAMYQEQVTAATCNLWDNKTNTYNLPFINNLFPGEDIGVYHICKRTQGFYVVKGNPQKISGFKDLTRTDIIFLNREKGSGTRVLLDSMLKELSIDPQKINGYLRSVTSPLVAANTVAKNGADLSLGPERTALQVAKIDFIPLQKENFDLVIRNSDLGKEPIKYMLELLNSCDFQEEIAQLKGYDITGMGEKIL